MFARAVEVARQFTRPVVISQLLYDRSVKCGMGAFVVVNDDGWIVTAAHLFEPMAVFPAHQKEIAAYEAARQPGGKTGRKPKGVPRRNPEWLVEYSYWWARDSVQVKNVKASPELDIATGQLDPFDTTWFNAYPRFKNPSAGLSPGTSLCKLGYPFHAIKATHREGGGFDLSRGALPAPRFPLEGIFTRNIHGPKTRDGKFQQKFIETSSPGLRGQSGGPIFDTDGVVWGIQSRTNHLELGFSPKVSRGRREIEEHQFLSVGLGVHPEVIHAFLTAHGVTFAVA